MVIIFEEVFATRNRAEALLWIDIMLKVGNEYQLDSSPLLFQDWLDLNWKIRLVTDPSKKDLVVGLDIDDEYVSMLLLKL